ncbi:N-acetylmuramoyl-L-alanine amidase [Gammaproteobacteria bacterium]
MKQLSRWWWLWLVLSPGYGVAATNIIGLHLQGTEGYSTLVLDLDGSVGVNLFTLDSPNRVVVDLPGAHLSNPRQIHALKNAVIRGMRAASQSDGRLRIVLDVAHPLWPRNYFTGDDKNTHLVIELRDSGGIANAMVPKAVAPKGQPISAVSSRSPVAPTAGHTIGKRSPNTGLIPEPLAPSHPIPPEVATVVHEALAPRPTTPSPSVPQPVTPGKEEGVEPLKNREKAAETVMPPSVEPISALRNSSEAVSKPAPQTSHQASPAPHTQAKVTAPWNGRSAILSPPAVAKGRDIVVAVDAGHGGKDPGATGPGGTEEKDVTLAIARRVADLLRRERGMRPVLTRNGDYFVPLRERIQKAHTFKADLFISIHADAAHDSSVTGASVYVLSEQGASSEAARFLAEKENSVDLVGGVHLEGRDNNLARTLLDMSQSATRDASLTVASRLLSSMEQVGTLSRTAVERAGFLVLKSPDIPSVLVETAYLSNPDEEERLNDSHYQQTIAQAIMKGLRAYFLRSPPSGTLLAQTMEASTMELVRR